MNTVVILDTVVILAWMNTKGQHEEGGEDGEAGHVALQPVGHAHGQPLPRLGLRETGSTIDHAPSFT